MPCGHGSHAVGDGKFAIAPKHPEAGGNILSAVGDLGRAAFRAASDDFLKEVRKVASALGLSQADVMRRSMNRGFPELRKQYQDERLANQNPPPFSWSRCCNRVWTSDGI